MGREVLAAATDRDDLSVALAVSRSPGEEIESVAVEPSADLDDLLAARDPDVLVDFTAPAASVAHVQSCAAAGVPAVVGTTGFDEGQLGALRSASDEVAVLQASNFARGVAALRRALREAVEALPDYDVELTETHHNGKRDAPSGTAKTLLDDVDEARGEALDRVHGREGDQPREPGEVGVHARRAGDIAGEHEALLAGNHETVALTHRAGSRGVFAEGALDAATWLAGRDPGWYDFAQVLN
jgi:4-hydroxy-tetrahydrodipicolinate reductase